MKKEKKSESRFLHFVAWLTGVLVSLAVGFGMTGKVLTIPWLPEIVTVVAGWVVVVTTLLSVLFAIIHYK